VSKCKVRPSLDDEECPLLGVKRTLIDTINERVLCVDGENRATTVALAGAQAETRMVQRTSDRIADHQAFGERSAIMRASSPNREQLVAMAGKEHRSVTDVSADQAAIGNVLECDSLRKIGSLWLGLLAYHDAGCAA